MARTLININKASATDDELLSCYKKTTEAAYLGELYKRYMPLVYGVCLKYLGVREDAQDAVMQIFEELLKKVLDHEVQNFRPWLYVFTKNHCLMRLRKLSKDKTIGFDEKFMEFADEFHLDSVLEDEKKAQALHHCIDNLPNLQQISVKLFFLEELSYKEIAERERLDLNKVKSFIQNGKRNLKICLKNKGIH